MHRIRKAENRRQKNPTSDFAGLICASHNNSSSIEKVQRFHRSEEQNPQILAYAGTGFINYIYTKFATFASTEIYENVPDNQRPASTWIQNGFSGSFGRKREQTGGGFSVERL